MTAAETALRQLLADIETSDVLDTTNDHYSEARRNASHGAIVLWRLRSKAARASVVDYLRRLAREGLGGR